jgi:hypothetical protein
VVTGKRHNAEAELLRFLERPDQTADYVRRTAEWIKQEFPGSAPSMLPKLRQLYRMKIESQSRG